MRRPTRHPFYRLALIAGVRVVLNWVLILDSGARLGQLAFESVVPIFELLLYAAVASGLATIVEAVVKMADRSEAKSPD